eukprot:15144745-Alexandrium_andersonii.AAC.1
MELGARNLALRSVTRPGRHSTWRATLGPGEYAMRAIAAGGQVRLEAPGEILRVVASRPAWAVIAWPEQAALQAARAGVSPDLRVTIEAAVGQAWAEFRPRA